MTDILPATLLCLSLLSLSGCGSGGSDEQLTVGNITDQYLSLAEKIDSSALAPASDIPTTGSANYSGYVNTFVDTQSFGDGLIVGDLSLRIGFSGDGEVEGKVDDFVFIDLQDNSNNLPPRSDPVLSLDGRLNISGGSITRATRTNPTQFQANLAGGITLPPSISGADSDATAQVAGKMNGDFVEGGVRGSIVATSAVPGLPGVPLDGSFGAERD
ncbi:hypothetical protein [Yoonia sediminilitoris]|nr:hypothetical protein [Yoonia sediminilitoris]